MALVDFLKISMARTPTEPVLQKKGGQSIGGCGYEAPPSFTWNFLCSVRQSHKSLSKNINTEEDLIVRN